MSATRFLGQSPARPASGALGRPDPTTLVPSLRSAATTMAVELRPPRAELDASAGLEAWIDTYHAVRGLTRHDTPVLLTDGAVGRREEDSLRHLVANLGDDAPRHQIVPFLTTKHPLAYCLDFADRAAELGFRSIVVLGGDPHGGPPRCVPRGSMLRKAIRERRPGLELGGWANPHKDPARQVAYLVEARVVTDFYLTQVVSHHDLQPVERFLTEVERQRLDAPGLFGVFYYRSPNHRTLDALAPFLPVPRTALEREFREGATATGICARTIRALRTLGVRNVYVSNLPVGRAPHVLRDVLDHLRGQDGG